MLDWVEYAGYAHCPVLENEHCRVVLGPQCGGRVLEYAWHGTNALMRDPAHDGWVAEPGREPAGMLFPSGGRFDIGPERLVPPRPELWYGPWQAEAAGPATVRLTSQRCEAAGVRLVREFTLAAGSSHLACTQTVHNVSADETRWCHWSRTFGQGHGICIVPLTPRLSRFPQQYVMYGPGPVINHMPADPAIRVRAAGVHSQSYLEVWDTPAYPKLGLDSYAGWFGYLMPSHLLFLKRFHVFPERVYNEMAGLTISLWYYRDVACELEPIGPMEVLAPGGASSFTEDWWLVPHPFPARRDALDLAAVEAVAQAAMR